MMMIIRLVIKAMLGLVDGLLKAVPAVNNSGFMPRWRNLGRSITPYHFMQPVLIPIKVEQKRRP